MSSDQAASAAIRAQREVFIAEPVDATLYFRRTHYRLPSSHQENVCKTELHRFEAAWAKLLEVTKVHERLSESESTPFAEQLESDEQLACACSLATEALGSFKLDNSAVHHVVVLLYPIGCDVKLMFRSLPVWKLVVQTMKRCFESAKQTHAPPPDGASVDWRLLRKLLEEVIKPSKRVAQSPVHDVILSQVRGSISDLSKTARFYMPSDALRELWLEVRPFIHQDNPLAPDAVGMMTLLMPVSERLMECPELVSEILGVMLEVLPWFQHANWLYLTVVFSYRIALNFKSKFDWTPYAERVVDALLHSFRLPVGHKDEVRGSMKLGGSGYIALVCPSEPNQLYELEGRTLSRMCSNDTTGLLWTHLKRFVSQTEVYLRVSQNNLAVNGYMLHFYSSFVSNMRERLRQQRRPERKIPIEYHLTDDTIKFACELLLPLILPCIYSKSNSMSRNASNILWIIASLTPQRFFDPMVRHASIGLATTTEKHQTCAALDLVCGSVGPLARTEELQARLLEFFGSESPMLLRALDHNDEAKNILANRLLLVAVNQLPLSVLGDEEEVVAAILQTHISYARHLTRSNELSNGFFLATRSLFASCRPGTIEMCAKILLRAINENASYKIAPTFRFLVASVVRSCPAVALKVLIPALAQTLLSSARPGKLCPPSNGVEIAIAPPLSTQELEWNTHLLRGALEGSDSASSLPYVDLIVSVVERLVRPPTTRSSLKQGYKLLQTLLRTLTQNSISSWHRLNPSEMEAVAGKPELESLTGRSYASPDVDMSWATPSAEAIKTAVSLLNVYCGNAVKIAENPAAERDRRQEAMASNAQAEKWLALEETEPLTVQAVRREALLTLRYVLSGGWTVVDCIEERQVESLPESVRPVYHGNWWWRNLRTRFVPEVPSDCSLTFSRVQILDLVHDTIFAPAIKDTSAGKAVDEGGDSIDAKTIKVAVKLLAVVDNSKSNVGNRRRMAIDQLSEFVRRLFTEIDRNTSRLSALLGGEMMYYDAVQSAQLKLTKPQVDRLLNDLMALATSHRVDSVRLYTGEIFCRLYSRLCQDERFPVVETLLNKLQALCARAEKSEARHEELVVAARGKDPSSEEQKKLKAFRADPPHHEISGTLQLIGAKNVASSAALKPEYSLRLTELLIEFPDMEHKQDEFTREAVIKDLSAFVAQHSADAPTVRGIVDQLLAPAHVVEGEEGASASSKQVQQALHAKHVTKLMRYLQMVISYFHVQQKSIPSARSIETLLQLTVDKQTQVRRYAMAILSNTMILLKTEYQKKRVPFPKNEDGTSAVNVEDPGYTRPNHHVGLSVLPETWEVELGEAEASSPVSKNATDYAEAVERLKKATTIDPENVLDSWLIKVIRLQVVDAKKFSMPRMQFWKGISRAAGPEVVVPSLLKAVEFIKTILSEQSTASKETLIGFYAAMGELLCAAVRSAKRHPEQRKVALAKLFELVEHTCTSAAPLEVMHEVNSAVNHALLSWGRLEECRSMCDLLLTKAATLPSHSQDLVRVFGFLASLIHITPYQFRPFLVRKIITAAEGPLVDSMIFNPFNQGRMHSGAVLSAVMGSTRIGSRLWAANVGLDDEIVAFGKRILSRVVNPAEYLSGSEEVADVETSGSAPAEGTLSAKEVLKRKQLALAKTVLIAFAVAPFCFHERIVPEIIMTLGMLSDIRLPESDDFARFAKRCARNVAFARVSPDAATTALKTIASIITKGNGITYGTTRLSFTVMLMSIRVYCFIHQFRIDRKLLASIAFPAAAVAMGHPDRRVRNDGQITMSVLVKIVPASETSALLTDCLKTLRKTQVGSETPPPAPLPPAEVIGGAIPGMAPKVLGNSPPISPNTLVTQTPPVHPSTPTAVIMSLGTSKEKSARLAAVVTLCGSLLAYPESVPKWAPKVMSKLAPLARDRSGEVSAVVRDTFEQWWKTHRDRWQFEHKAHFTEDQNEELSQLFQTPSYYV